MLGLDRWVARVAAYVVLMSDEYPPFRLDQGGEDDGGSRPRRRLGSPLLAEAASRAGRRAARDGGTAGRVVLIVVGSIAALLAFGLLVGGCALVAVDQTQRDDDGFLMSPSEDFSTSTYAIVSESADIDTDGAEWALDTFLGTVRIRSESDRPVFVGIGPRADVDRYLASVERDVVTDFDDRDPHYSRDGRGGHPGPPGARRSGPRRHRGRGSRRSTGSRRTATGASS